MAGNSVLIMPAQLVTHQNTVDMSERFGLNDTRQEKVVELRLGVGIFQEKKTVLSIGARTTNISCNLNLFRFH